LNTQHINLDVTKRPAVTPVIYLGQGDKNGTEIQAGVYDGGAALPLSGMSAKFCMRTPDGEGYYETTGTVSGNTATFQIDETYAANVAGTTDVAYVEILQGETVVCSTNRFRVVVHQNATEGADPAQAWTNGVEEFLEDAQDQIDQAMAAAEEATEAAEAIVDYNVPLMSPTQRGGAKLGAGLQVGADEKLSVKVDGTTITVDADGTMHGASTYELPTMSPTTKGGAKQGDGLTVDSNEKLNLGPLVKHSAGVTDGSALYGVQGEGYATQSGTPTPTNPQPIMVARGRNLYDLQFIGTSYAANSSVSDQVLSIVGVTDNNAYVNDVRPASASYDRSSAGVLVEVEPNTTYCVSLSNPALSVNFITQYDASKVSLGYQQYSGSVFSFTTNANARYVTIRVGFASTTIGATYQTTIQLELGTTPTPYVPYGHVGLEVTANGQTTVTPIPLPSKGFLGALPDGTKDTLTIDSAGHVGGLSSIGRKTADNADTFSYSSGNTSRSIFNVAFNARKLASSSDVSTALCSHAVSVAPAATWVPGNISQSNGNNNLALTVGPGISTTSALVSTYPTLDIIYPLSNPATWDGGYINLPDLPEGATVTIPELDNVGVDYWVKGIPEVTEYGQAMQTRLQGEIDEAEQAIADVSAAFNSVSIDLGHFPPFTTKQYTLPSNGVYLFAIGNDYAAGIVGIVKTKATDGTLLFVELTASSYFTVDTSQSTNSKLVVTSGNADGNAMLTRIG